jgi:PPK2 family polyphosphate:nucleotide phosphotransferase
MIKIKDLPTDAPDHLEKDAVQKETDKIVEEIGDLCRIFQAEQKRAILIVLQGMDASGKDGTAREVFKHVSPTIVHAHSFKKPTDEEFAHDFLWRIHQHTPGKGMIKVFNRSHYEDVLIQRVHKWIDEDTVAARFDAINAFERNLVLDNNTTILKFFLNISREKQKEKLQERIDVRRKNWKHNPGDWKEAEKWDDYMFCYEEVLNRSEIPWIPVPVDQKWYRNYFVAKKLQETLIAFNMEYPPVESND